MVKIGIKKENRHCLYLLLDEDYLTLHRKYAGSLLQMPYEINCNLSLLEFRVKKLAKTGNPGPFRVSQNPLSSPFFFNLTFQTTKFESRPLCFFIHRLSKENNFKHIPC